MELLFLFSAIFSFLVPAVIGYYYFSSINPQRLSKINLSLTLLGFLYLVQGILSLLWFFDMFLLSAQDFLMLSSLILLLQTIIIFKFVSDFSENKKIYLFLIFYLISLPVLLLNPGIIILLTPLSFLLHIIIAINISNLPNYKKPAYSLLIYSLVSLGLIVSTTFASVSSEVFLLTSNLLFLVFIVLLTNQLKYYPPYIRKSLKANSSPIIETLKHFIFIVLLTNFIFIGTLSIHEFGHMGVARAYGCSDTKIIYGAQGIPHTETICENLNKSMGILGGLLLPVIISFFLFFVGGKFIKEIATMILGFNLLIGYKDFLGLGFSPGISLFFTLLGGALGTVGLILLAKSRTTDEYFSVD